MLINNFDVYLHLITNLSRFVSLFKFFANFDFIDSYKNHINFML
jgi:hypothetical protein